MDKNIKKWIVNILTSLRVAGTIFLPVLCTCVSSTTFLFIIGAILLTDLIDGKLARHWEVSTLFGSLFDMGADKLFGISILFVLALTYPIMIIPACLEIGIACVNLKSVLKGNKAKSRWMGKFKMGVSFVSITSLLLIGASPEISVALENNTGTINEMIKNISNFFTNNKEIIESTVIPTAIAAESATLLDYVNEYKKVKDNESKKLLEELKRYKEYIKDYKFKKYMKEIMFNEEYHKQTVEEPLVKKLMPNKNKVVDK